jgi:hypothetical protein
MHCTQYVVTPSMSKRLIARAMAAHPQVRAALTEATLVIVAGTTNGYVAEEILGALGQREGFSREGFRRGAVVPPTVRAPAADLPGDVVIHAGLWQKGKTVFDVIDDLDAGDLILKGGNALDVPRRRAAVLIAHPQAGTAGVILPAVFGRRVRLLVPIGLEKRVDGDLDDLAAELNAAEAEGPRMLPLPGPAFTELDAISLLTGATARLVAAGGIHGAEGAVWIAVKGRADELAAADALVQSLAGEPPCEA